MEWKLRDRITLTQNFQRRTEKQVKVSQWTSFQSKQNVKENTGNISQIAEKVQARQLFPKLQIHKRSPSRFH